jgi:hypothetical protein
MEHNRSSPLDEEKSGEIHAVFVSHPMMLIFKWSVILGLWLVSLAFLLMIVPDMFVIRTVFFLTMIVGLSAMLISVFIHWSVNTDILTDRQLISVHFHGLFHYSLEEIELSNVHSIDVRQEGILPNIFNYGDLLISSEIFGKNTQHDIILKNIAHINDVAKKVKKQCAFCKNR